MARDTYTTTVIIFNVMEYESLCLQTHPHTDTEGDKRGYRKQRLPSRHIKLTNKFGRAQSSFQCPRNLEDPGISLLSAQVKAAQYMHSSREMMKRCVIERGQISLAISGSRFRPIGGEERPIQPT